MPSNFRFKLGRSNLPLTLAGAVTAVSLVIVVVVLLASPEPGEPADPPQTEAPADTAPDAAAPDDASPDARPRAADPIGDLIASLPEKGQPPAAPVGEGVPVLEGEPAWRRYATAADIPERHALIAVVIDDVGLNKSRTEDVISLPAAVTLSFMPYGDDVQERVDKARTLGHEVMLHLPMQPESAKEDPGPQALLVTLPPQALHERVVWNMDRFTGYVGFNNHMGSKFTADQAGMAVVMREAARRGLMFLDSRTTPHSKGTAAAASFGVPLLKRDVFIDNVASEAAIRAQLDKAVELARKRGSAIVIGHPHKETVAALKSWIPTLDGVTLVPITTLLSQRGTAVAETRSARPE